MVPCLCINSHFEIPGKLSRRKSLSSAATACSQATPSRATVTGSRSPFLDSCLSAVFRIATDLDPSAAGYRCQLKPEGMEGLLELAATKNAVRYRIGQINHHLSDLLRVASFISLRDLGTQIEFLCQTTPIGRFLSFDSSIMASHGRLLMRKSCLMEFGRHEIFSIARFHLRCCPSDDRNPTGRKRPRADIKCAEKKCYRQADGR